MTSRCASLIATLAFLPALLFGAPAAQARGDLGIDRETCVLKVGPDLMYFTGYLPDASRRKFCEDVPELGKAIFVFDYAESELREMKADFRILRQTSEAETPDDMESATFAYLPPAIYPQGTFSFEQAFTQPGDYVGVVTVEGASGQRWVSRFPFSVAKSHVDSRPYYLIAAAAALALLLVFSSQGGPRWRRGGRLARRP